VPELAKALQKFKKHLPYLPRLAPADFFIFRKVKEGLAGQSLDQDSIENAWEGVTRTLTAVTFTAAFRSWLEHCKQCICIGGKFIKKS
jgi:hypothetical protein